MLVEGLGHRCQKTTHVLETSGFCWPCCRRRQGQKPTHFLSMRRILACAPGLPKTTWPNKHFGIPFNKRMVCWPCRQRRQGPKPTNFWKMRGCLALVPQASKKHLDNKTLRNPIHETNCLLALQPRAASPKTNSFLEHAWFVALGAPGLQQKHLADTPLRDPFE